MWIQTDAAVISIDGLCEIKMETVAKGDGTIPALCVRAGETCIVLVEGVDNAQMLLASIRRKIDGSGDGIDLRTLPK